MKQPQDNPSPPPDNTKWQELMGKDILFRITSPGSTTTNKKKKPKQSEVGDIVRVSFTGKLVSSTAANGENPFFQSYKNQLIVLGDGDVVPGLEMGIRFCPVGSSAMVKCHSKYAFGVTGRKGGDGLDAVPADAEVEYTFKVHEIIQECDVLDIVQAKKEFGNESFKYDLDDGTKALRCWKKGLELLEGDGTDEDETPRHPVGINLWNNIALVAFRRREHKEAKEACWKVLDKYDDKNFKAWMRLGWVCLMTGEYEDVEKAIENMEMIDNDNKELVRLSAEYKKKKSEYKKKEKEMYAKMLKKDDLNGEIKKEEEVIKEPAEKNPKRQLLMTWLFAFVVCVVLIAIWMRWRNQLFDMESEQRSSEGMDGEF